MALGAPLRLSIQLTHATLSDFVTLTLGSMRGLQGLWGSMRGLWGHSATLSLTSHPATSHSLTRVSLWLNSFSICMAHLFLAHIPSTQDKLGRTSTYTCKAWVSLARMYHSLAAELGPQAHARALTALQQAAQVSLA